MEIKKYIRSVKDFPKPGILFRDITTLLDDPVKLKLTLSELFNLCSGLNINKVAGIEAR